MLSRKFKTTCWVHKIIFQCHACIDYNFFNMNNLNFFNGVVIDTDDFSWKIVAIVPDVLIKKYKKTGFGLIIGNKNIVLRSNWENFPSNLAWILIYIEGSKILRRMWFYQDFFPLRSHHLDFPLQLPHWFQESGQSLPSTGHKYASKIYCWNIFFKSIRGVAELVMISGFFSK